MEITDVIHTFDLSKQNGMETQYIQVHVLLIGNKPKGVWKSEEYKKYDGKKWWDDFMELLVPKEDWDSGKVTVGTIKKYYDMWF